MELPTHQGSLEHNHSHHHNANIQSFRARVAKPLVSIGLLALGVLLIIYGVNNCKDGHVGNDVVQASCPTDTLQVTIGALLVAGSSLFTVRFMLQPRVSPAGTAESSPAK